MSQQNILKRENEGLRPTEGFKSSLNKQISTEVKVHTNHVS